MQTPEKGFSLFKIADVRIRAKLGSVRHITGFSVGRYSEDLNGYLRIHQGEKNCLFTLNPFG